MLVEEHEASVLYRSEYNPYFKTDARLFPAMEFLVQLLQHLPDARTHLVRRYGLYSSRAGRGRASPGWCPWPPRGGCSSTRSSLPRLCERSSRIVPSRPSPLGNRVLHGRGCWPRSTR
jgi:hypothetical protein